MKVYVDGGDKLGWSIDIDRDLLLQSINRIGGLSTSSILNANIVHNVWWNRLASKNLRNYLIKFMRPPLLATTSNYVDLDDSHYVLKNEFDMVSKVTTAWIVPSIKQKETFDRHGIKNFYQPFYLDLDLFAPMVRNSELYEKVGIPRGIIQNKIVIGSFQRDSLGLDLEKPKWQKGPELLVYLLKDLPKERFVLLLAGPRRHYVIKECKKYGIPYYYMGKECCTDDITVNALPISMMPFLYALTDIYLITSRSEGGPKAAMEATATKTFIMSTDVGLSRDFIESDVVFTDDDKFRLALTSLVVDFEGAVEFRRENGMRQYENCSRLLAKSEMDERLKNIYATVCQKMSN